MTEQKYIRSFGLRYGKYWIWTLFFGLILGVAIASQLKPSYEGVVSFTLTRKQDLTQNKAQFYLYDGYYSEQSAILARNNLALWLQSPKTVYDVYTKAGLTTPRKSAESFTRLFRVSGDTNPANSTNTVDLTFPASSLGEGQKLGTALTDYVRGNYTTQDATININDPLILTVDPPRALIILGITFGIALLVFLTTLVTYYLKAVE